MKPLDAGSLKWFNLCCIILTLYMKLSWKIMSTSHMQPQTHRRSSKSSKGAKKEKYEIDVASLISSFQIILGFFVLGLTFGAIDVSLSNYYGWLLVVFSGCFGMYEIVFTLACMYRHRNKMSRSYLMAAGTNLVISFLFAGMQAVYAVVSNNFDFVYLVFPGVLSGFLSTIVFIKTCISIHCNNPNPWTSEHAVYLANESEAAEVTDLPPPYPARKNLHFTNELGAAEITDLPPPYPWRQTLHFTNESGTAEVTDLPPPYPGRK